MDLSLHGYWHPARQLCSQHYRGLSKGRVCRRLGAHWYAAQNLMQCSLLTTVHLAIGLLVMMYPILCQVKYETLHNLVRDKNLWKQIGFSVVVNWLVAPFFMVRFVLPSSPKE